MLASIATIDKAGRITLPQIIIEALGVQPDQEVVLEVTEVGVVIKPKVDSPPITARIGVMNLPVAGWEEMKKETEAGRLS
jgi:bifunctional DNA-binding transcriptional regulator/antitoxin component of YhaV-PrlF toxin-antitoxin module